MPFCRFSLCCASAPIRPSGPLTGILLALMAFLSSLATAPAWAQNMAYVKDLPTPAEIAPMATRSMPCGWSARTSGSATTT